MTKVYVCMIQHCYHPCCTVRKRRGGEGFRARSRSILDGATPNFSGEAQSQGPELLTHLTICRHPRYKSWPKAYTLITPNEWVCFSPVTQETPSKAPETDPWTLKLQQSWADLHLDLVLGKACPEFLLVHLLGHVLHKCAVHVGLLCKDLLDELGGDVHRHLQSHPTFPGQQSLARLKDKRLIFSQMTCCISTP